MSAPDFVTNSAWLERAGRRDAIDDVADQFERPTAAGAELFWTRAETRWPRTSRGWQTVGHAQPTLEHRAR